VSIGDHVRRIEDPPLIKGEGKYVADIRLPDQCEAVVVRSQYAHAKIKTIHTEAAKRMADVLLVLTANDLPADLAPIPMRLAPEEALNLALQYPLARERVRYVGEPVALVVARNRYLAEDAAEQVSVEYEPLSPVTDVDESLKPGAPVLHPKMGTNDLFVLHSLKGSVEEAFKHAAHILEETFYVQRHTGIPLETRGLLAVCDDKNRLTVYGPTKVVHFNRQILARLLKKNIEEIRFVEPNVGGGFGQRGEFYPEDYLIPYAAMLIKRPVRWIEDRMEHFRAINHSREQKHRLKVGFTNEGRILALKDEIFVDQGAYIRTHGVTVPQLTQGMFTGPYDIAALDIRTHVVATNKMGIGTYRGPGRFEGNFVRERLIDRIARHLHLDPTVVRERNFIKPEQMPYSNGISALGEVVEFDSGDYLHVLNQARRVMDWEGFARRKAEAKTEGRLLGQGFAVFVEKSGRGPWEFAEVEISDGGAVTCKSGLADVGQGVQTMLAQMCSDQLGVAYTDIRVICGDTDAVEKGNGSFATRGTVVGGNAAWLAAGELKEKLIRTAGEIAGLPMSELALQNHAVIRKPDQAILFPFKTIVAECVRRGVILRAKQTFMAEHMTYPYGVHAAEVEIDPETGAIKIRKYYIGYDLGRVINPMLVHGQLTGGMAQGLGGALFEELKYDDQGQLIAGTFMDYLMPGATEVPDIITEYFERSPSPLNPLGVKGVGEGGAVAVAPAIANAVADALDGYPLKLTSLPVKPESIRRAIRQGAKTQNPKEVPS
jgi:carbon-monoxide dehydrogenase large subunit